MPAIPDRKEFDEHLRIVLSSIYDLAELRASPLVDLLSVDRGDNPAFSLQRVLIDAIECLRPGESTPADAKHWRVYQILRRRYTQQLTQREVAGSLGLSIRQLQREEKLARVVLADHLWNVHCREGTRTKSMAMVREEPLSRTEELAGFQEAVSAEWVNLDAVIQDVLQTMAPLLSHSQVSIGYTAQADPQHLWLPGPMLRQALLTLIGMAVRSVPTGTVHIQTVASTQQICLAIDATSGPKPISPIEVDKTAGVRITEELLHLCQGTLEVTWDEPRKSVFSARILLPASEQATVLVIDDNADTRQLCQRYLVGSRYRFAGAQDAQKGLALAKELSPDIIVLDVMIPGTDGWALLGQLREDPQTGAIPVVICTILAQRELALALGAAEFVRKPINRAAFLALLDRQLDRRHQESG